MASQDVPPPGGFGTIPIHRTYAKPIIRQGIVAAILVGATINGFYVFAENRRKIKLFRLEQVEHYVATHPFLIAEQERRFLKHLSVIREEEREIMKDHPSWKVGTLYGEPVYKTLPSEYLPHVGLASYIFNRPQSEYVYKVAKPDWHHT